MTLNLVLVRAFLSMCLVWLQFWPRRHLYWMDSSFWWKDLLYAWSQRLSPYSRWGLIKASYIVITAAPGKRFCNLRRSSIVLFIFPNTIFRWSLNFNWVSSIISKCFCDNVRVTLTLLNSNGGWTFFFNLPL